VSSMLAAVAVASRMPPLRPAQLWVFLRINSRVAWAARPLRTPALRNDSLSTGLTERIHHLVRAASPLQGFTLFRREGRLRSVFYTRIRTGSLAPLQANPGSSQCPSGSVNNGPGAPLYPSRPGKPAPGCL